MITAWGETLDPDAPLPEHPRPQLVRDAWLNLNGRWDHTFTPLAAGSDAIPERWDGQIIVPFPPEAPLSGVNRVLQPDELLWYRRDVQIPPHLIDDRLLLHFGAVDQDCTVYVDAGRGPVQAGSHRGGVLPFTLDLTAALAGSSTFTLYVQVRDVTDTSHRSRGKQKLNPSGIWYTPHSGIWQTVWLEAVPHSHLTGLDLVPDITEGIPGLTVTVHGSTDVYATAEVTISSSDTDLGSTELARLDVPIGEPVRVALPGARLWSPEDPHLHDVTVRLGRDHVTSYAGLRTVGLTQDTAGRTRFALNGKPYLHAGLLDQGYWPDGLVTAPSDAALEYDVQLAKELGFTVLRKHIKVEPLRWYHHCDRLGILVWQDMVNGGRTYRDAVVTAPVALPHLATTIADKVSFDDSKYALFGRQDAEGRAEFLTEVDDTVALLANTPSVVAWVPFNEGWGQFDAAAVAARVKAIDPTRLVDHASGWHDQGAGDMVSRHVYFKPYTLSAADAADPRAAVLSEYGGYSHRVDGHTWSQAEFGYRRIAERDTFERAYLRLQHHQIGRAVDGGLAGFIHTQLSDVEQETNGLVTYDRRVLKIDADRVRTSNERLRHRFDVACGAPEKALTVTERELTTRTSLTRPDGRLNPDAVGWARHPLLDTSGIGRGRLGKGRNKRWEYWAVTTPTHVIALVVSHIDYAGVNSLWILDRATGETILTEATTPLGAGVSLPGSLGRGRTTLRTKHLEADITDTFDDAGRDATRIRARTDRVTVDVIAHRPAFEDGHESLAVVVPWSDRLFQYTVKDVCRPATGTLTVDGTTHDVASHDSWATLDHGRGRWPHDITWNWGAGSGTVDGHTVGIQVGGKWTDGTGSVENSLYLDGRLTKISQELVWTYDLDAPTEPWRVTGDDVELTLVPFHVKESHMDLKVLGNDTIQVFGHWHGRARFELPDGTREWREFSGLTGWAEDVHNRW